MSLIPDGRALLFARLSNLVRPGGLIAIADPNGYSRTFNRQHVIHDWPLVASNFEDWTAVVRRLAGPSFERPTVWRQMRRADLSVVSLPVDEVIVDHAARGEAFTEDEYEYLFDNLPVYDEDSDSAVELIPAGAVDPLEVEDFHLGYVVTARKRA